MSRIGIVNCLKMPEPDPDEQLLLSALAEAGAEAALVPWDDPDQDPGSFDVCVLRSCWNYFERPDAFARWVDEAAERTRLLNPPAVVKANLHKQYLQGLHDAGVPIVPTRWAPMNQPFDLAAAMDESGWDDVVIKPSVSAGSYRTERHSRRHIDTARVFLDELVRDRDAMIQPYMHEVDRSGERCIVWIDGELTHTVRKHPRFAGGQEQVSDGMAVAAEEAAFAETVLDAAAAGDDLLYARIDVIQDGDGGLLLSELELLEPSLFLKQSGHALARLVSAMVRLADEEKPDR